MRTIQFKPDLQSIEQRKQIIPFGRASKYYLQDPSNVNFILYTTEQEVQKTEKVSAFYQPVSLFRAANYKIQGEIPVKITNIPLNVTHGELLELLNKKCKAAGFDTLAKTLFTRLTLALDRDTRKSRGIAYASCNNLEKARDLAKIIRGITIEEYVLCAEVLNN